MLGLGITTLSLYFIGLVFIIIFFIVKQRWIVIHTPSINLSLFYKQSENVEQFKQTVLAIQRQLKTPTIAKSNISRSSVTNGASQKS